eukprot:COSAG06_NODE_1410_length_9546_cov_102.602519_4_plen_236_part_00
MQLVPEQPERLATPPPLLPPLQLPVQLPGEAMSPDVAAEEAVGAERRATPPHDASLGAERRATSPHDASLVGAASRGRTLSSRDEITLAAGQSQSVNKVSLTVEQTARTVQIGRIPVDSALQKKLRSMLRAAGCPEAVRITVCPASEHRDKEKETGLTWALATFETPGDVEKVMSKRLGSTAEHYQLRRIDRKLLAAKSGGTIGRVANVSSSQLTARSWHTTACLRPPAYLPATR